MESGTRLTLYALETCIEKSTLKANNGPRAKEYP